MKMDLVDVVRGTAQNSASSHVYAYRHVARATTAKKCEPRMNPEPHTH